VGPCPCASTAGPGRGLGHSARASHDPGVGLGSPPMAGRAPGLTLASNAGVSLP
jgi:hypothetical protein